MSVRKALCLFIIIAALFSVTPVLAGGWAVITLDHLPQDVAAGSPFELSFHVRQHGNHLMEGLETSVHFTNAESGEHVDLPAEEMEDAGHYAIRVSLPSPGSWSWSIQAFTVDQPMPDLMVYSDEIIHTNPRQQSGQTAGYAGLLMAGTALIVWLVRKNRWVFALILFGLTISAAGFVIADAPGGALASEASPVLSSSPPAQQVGKALFVAKGCVMCHQNWRIDPKYVDFSVNMGPDLTSYSGNPEFLSQWLADPSRIKPGTQMPNLGLSKDEIQALIDFLIVNTAK